MGQVDETASRQTGKHREVALKNKGKEVRPRSLTAAHNNLDGQPGFKYCKEMLQSRWVDQAVGGNDVP